MIKARELFCRLMKVNSTLATFPALIILPAKSRLELVAAGGRSYGVGAAPGRDGLQQGLVAGLMIKAYIAPGPFRLFIPLEKRELVPKRCGRCYHDRVFFANRGNLHHG